MDLNLLARHRASSIWIQHKEGAVNSFMAKLNLCRPF